MSRLSLTHASLNWKTVLEYFLFCYWSFMKVCGAYSESLSMIWWTRCSKCLTLVHALHFKMFLGMARQYWSVCYMVTDLWFSGKDVMVWHYKRTIMMLGRYSCWLGLMPVFNHICYIRAAWCACESTPVVNQSLQTTFPHIPF